MRGGVLSVQTLSGKIELSAQEFCHPQLRALGPPHVGFRFQLPNSTRYGRHRSGRLQIPVGKRLVTASCSTIRAWKKAVMARLWKRLVTRRVREKFPQRWLVTGHHFR